MPIQAFIVYTFLFVFMTYVSKQAVKGCGIYSNEALLSNSFNSKGIIAVMLVYALIYGMSWGKGADHLMYMYIYEYNDLESLSRFEIGYRLLTLFCMKLHLPISFYFFILVFIEIFFYLYAFRKEPYIIPFVCIFIFTQGEVAFWMNGIRQAIAMIIWFSSIQFIAEKDIKKFYIFNIIALLFHASAIILLVAYPLLVRAKHIFKSIPLQYVLLALAMVMQANYSLISGLLEGALDTFNTLLGFAGGNTSYEISELDGTGDVADLGFVFYWRLIETLIIIAYSNKMTTFYNSRKFNIVYTLYFIGICVGYMLPLDSLHVYRLFRYLFVFKSAMIGYFAYYLSCIGNGKISPILLLLLAGELLSFYGPMFLQNWQFDFLFQHDTSELLRVY